MQKRTNTIKAYFKLIRSLKPLHKASTLLNLFDHFIKPILLYGYEIWAPVYLKYKNPTRTLTEKASSTHDLRDQFPYITKYMDINDPILNCVSVPWGSNQNLPTCQYMQNWVVLRGPISSVTKTFGLHPQ